MLLEIVIWVVVIGLLATRFLTKAFAPVSADDLGALHVLSGVPGGSARVDRLFAAYLSRARRYRTGWSVVGWTSGLVLAFGLTLGAGSRNDTSDPTSLMVLLGFSGYLLGAIVAELHHLRRPKDGVRTASLTPRSLRLFMSARQRWFLRVAALVAIGLALVGLGLQRTEHDRFETVGAPGSARILVQRAESYWVPLVIFGAASVVVWCVVELVQRAIVERPRPALPDDLSEGDDAIRRASLTTVALGGAGLVVLFASREAFIVTAAIRGDAGFVPGIAGIAMFILAIHLAFRTRRVAWPRRKLEKDGGIW